MSTQHYTLKIALPDEWTDDECERVLEDYLNKLGEMIDTLSVEYPNLLVDIDQ